MKIRVLFFCIFVSALLILSGCNDAPDITDDPVSSAEPILLAGEGAPAYTIIRGDASSKGESQAALLLRRYMTLCGVETAIKTDWKDTPVTPYEIVVGKTNRTELENGAVPAPRDLGEEGYFVKAVGSRIYIGGGSDAATRLAVEKFLTEFFGYAGDEEKGSPVTAVTVPGDYEFIHKQSFDIASVTVDGKDLREYRITWESPLNIYDAGKAAEKMQAYFYDNCGIWMEIDKSNKGTGPAIYLRGENAKDGYMSVTVAEGDVIFAIDSIGGFDRGWNKFIEANFEGKKGDITLDAKFRFDTYLLEPVTYKEFGAVGDGKTDDFDAIIAAHAFANNYNLPVKADKGATYYIGAANKSAIIQTDTDWTGAKFILDDRAINTESHPARSASIFDVTPSLPRITLKVTSVQKNGKTIGVAPGQDCLVYIADSGTKRYIRYGANANSGSSQQEILLVDKNGNIDPTTPPAWDYNTVTTCYGIPINETPITIQGGEFHTLANEINPDKYISVSRNMDITRSNVTVKNVMHTVEQVQSYRAAYAGFFNVSYCNNVTIRDCGIQCHKGSYFTNDAGTKVLLGSYELGATATNNLTYVGLVQNNLFDKNGKLISQGLMGTNYCRNISMIDCEVARFDAHCQVHNVTIRGCTMERINLIGFGTALVEDTTILDQYIFNLRSDYGSMFAGDVILRNVKMTRENTARLAIFEGAWYNHDFGYPLYLPRTVTIENLSVPEGSYVTPFVARFDSYEDVTQKTLRSGKENKNPFILPDYIKVVSNPAGTVFRANGGGIPFPAIEGDTGIGGDTDTGIREFYLNFNAALSAGSDGIIPTISGIAHQGSFGSATLYDGNEVHSNMNLKQTAVDGDWKNQALLFTGRGNPNNATKTSNITLDVKPTNGSTNMDPYIYEEYKGKDFVISMDIRAAKHDGVYDGVNTDLVRLTSFYTPAPSGQTVTYGESLLRMNGNDYSLYIPSAGSRATPALNVKLTTDRFTNITVHVHPTKNTYDIYIDGKQAAKDLTLLSDSSIAKIGTYKNGELVLSDKANKMEDYCLSYARLCNTNGWTIPGDYMLLDNVKMYYSDTVKAD